MMPLRAAHAEFFADHIKPDIALTLSYNETAVTRDRVSSDLRNLHAEIDSRLYGRRFYKRPPSMRTQFWAVTEMLDLNPHVHIGWQLPRLGIEILTYALKQERLWLRYARSGEYEISPYTQGWEGYSLKCLTNSNDIVMSSDFCGG